MIIKEADSKSGDIEMLQALATRPDASADTRKRIEQEIRNIQAGIRGEQEAAYEMKVQWGEGRNWAIIHDLRIEHGGLVAQIDHIMINRGLDMWVCESKHFSEGVSINEHGEFAAFFGGKPYGVPSPIEQNSKHILILNRLFDSKGVDLPTRLGMTLRPSMKSLVLVSKRARIARPKVKIDGIETIIKNDNLFKTVCKSMDEASILGLGKIIGQETLERLAREIAALHQPASFNWAARFGFSEAVTPPAAAQAAAAPPAINPGRPDDLPPSAVPGEPVPAVASSKSKLICHSCEEPVPYNVAKFCWSKRAKFGGNVFCMPCQAKV